MMICRTIEYISDITQVPVDKFLNITQVPEYIYDKFLNITQVPVVKK